jgi:hypothetical protein
MQLSKFGIYVYILNVVDWVSERSGIRDGRVDRTELIGDLIFISDLPIFICYK